MKNLSDVKSYLTVSKKIILGHKLLFASIGLFLLSLIWFSWVVWNNVLPRKIHYHAGFIVVKDNKVMDFSDFQYMDIVPCSLTGEESEPQTPREEQIEKAHLHDNIGDVVHVEAKNAKWRDLFTNINYPVDYKSTAAYINGSKVQNFEDKLIKHYQSLVLFIGKDDDVQKFLGQAVTKQHIQEVAARSEGCGSP